MNMLKKATLAAALGASALTAASPAMARPYYHHGDTAAWAVGAGIVGLAVGAAIASDHHRDRYYDRGYYDNGYYVDNGYRYDRDDYYRWQRDHDDWRRGYDRDDYYARRGW